MCRIEMKLRSHFLHSWKLNTLFVTQLETIRTTDFVERFSSNSRLFHASRIKHTLWHIFRKRSEWHCTKNYSANRSRLYGLYFGFAFASFSFQKCLFNIAIVIFIYGDGKPIRLLFRDRQKRCTRFIVSDEAGKS